MRLLWIRHGQTRENQLKQYIGHMNSPLNERGRKQAQLLRQRLKNIKVDRIYSSDLLRCMETIKEFAAERNVAVIPCSQLRELNFGLWEGKTYAEIMAEYPEQGRAWYEDPFSISPPGGETLHQLGSRVDQVIKRILGEWKAGETVALISHGGPIRWFQGKWVENNPSLFWEKRPPGHGEALLYTFVDGMFVAEDLPDME
jgi:alpha-ribazole phosphatase